MSDQATVPVKAHVAVVGLGYVGLPLALAFSEHFACVGFDIDPARIAALQAGRDNNAEVDTAHLQNKTLSFTTDEQALIGCNTFIVTVPTPVDDSKRPLLEPLEQASALIGQHLRRGDVVIYESTVYPGATEETCVPVLERASGLTCNRDFFVGYSPERINPGDREHTLANTPKITSGSTPEAAAYVDTLYRRIVQTTHPVSSIRVAEAAKVVENTQRDANIALINELAIIFKKLGISTREVLEAAGSKWNFLPFRPGLVGGHCIGVDPYYLVHKAQAAGYFPEIIAASRRINEGMSEFVARDFMALMARHRLSIVGARVLVLGLTFKENCPDLRNTKVIDIIRNLRAFNAEVDVYDPVAGDDAATHLPDARLLSQPEAGTYDAILIAVAHSAFRAMTADELRRWLKPGGVLYDLKYMLPNAAADGEI
ncbi:MAG TPA: nucleotide sugar dehydrogenase [Pseudomonadales bacterium]|jgi:UDP-N-acetyl-D-galactosamine dehydrogenase